ncbi:MAG: biopolymer transporter ExbD [Desulfobacteraceae bacterium]|jgi:biopolymer transport protein ExbD
MDEKPFETMNVIPFVDIMLVLLTIVLTSSSFIASGRIPVDLPHASKNITEADRAAIIEMTVSGDIYFDGKAVTFESLGSLLSSISRDTGFVIRADREISLQRFIDVADMLKQLKFTKVAVQTQNGN